MKDIQVQHGTSVFLVFLVLILMRVQQHAKYVHLVLDLVTPPPPVKAALLDYIAQIKAISHGRAFKRRVLLILGVTRTLVKQIHDVLLVAKGAMQDGFRLLEQQIAPFAQLGINQEVKRQVVTHVFLVNTKIV
jgi:hypothetical protein